MSIGELIRIYEKNELIINLVYQRSFRWNESRKTRFIESLIIGIPIPPIFVFTNDDGKWELIDGLQRLSTIFQFAGVLRNPETKELESKFSPSGTKLIPSLNEIEWDNEQDDEKSLPLSIRLDVERVRIRVEILKRESDARAKFELFQRLNSGGAELSPQEARNCVATMLNESLFKELSILAINAKFIRTTGLTSKATEEQKQTELVLRFLAYRYKEYNSKIDVHDWLDEALIDISQDPNYPIENEKLVFSRTFDLLDDTMGNNAFRRYDNGTYTGGFSIAAFEAITHGVSLNIEKLSDPVNRNSLINKINSIWSETNFTESTKAGTRGSTRLGKLIPFSKGWFSI